MPTGIAGLDEITRGGLPRGRNTVILGGPGCGKTLLALQALVNGARHHGESGIFVAFEESARQIVRNASSFGWKLPELEREHLFLLDAQTRPEDLKVGDFDLVALLAGIAAKAKKMGAKRIVFDSVDVLLSQLDNIAKERHEIHRLMAWLGVNGLTGIITGKLDEGSPHAAQRYGFLQFMADCAVQLSHHTLERMSQRELRVIKYRGSAFSEHAAPMVIGPNGIEVAHIGSTQRVFPVSKQRVPTGITRLDAMLAGGYFRGSSVLITGAPGTAKSTLSGAFVAAACHRGERALYVSLDESAGEHVRNLSSVSIDLATHVASGRLKIYSARTEASSLEQHVVRIQTMLLQHRARFVVIDPLCALFRAGVGASVQSSSERLLRFTKSMGITTIATSLLDSMDTMIENTPLDVSAIADTWIHLSYAVQAGERNRALTIVKSRGMKHSNQVRELVLSDQGVTLTDVYTARGEVLMGTLRWQREMAEKADHARTELSVARKQQALRLAEAELEARLEALRRELALKRFELAASAREEIRRTDGIGHHRHALRRLRSGDRQTAAPQEKRVIRK